MIAGERDPRPTWSRKVQDFHSSDPAVQAALAGERYFTVTPGHLISSALETDYFTDVDDCLEFFGLDRDALKRAEPFDEEEIDGLEEQIINDADARLRHASDTKYVRWADFLIDAVSGDEETIGSILSMLKGKTPPKLSYDAREEADYIADKAFDSEFNEYGYDERHMRLQAARAVSLLERDGFAITLEMAIKSLEANGFISGDVEHSGDPSHSELRAKLARVAYLGTALELADGVLNPGDFGFDKDYININNGFSTMEEAYGSYREGLPIVLSAKDLTVFAQVYASPHELPEISADQKTQVLTALIKNTPARIRQLRQITPHVDQLASSAIEA